MVDFAVVLIFAFVGAMIGFAAAMFIYSQEWMKLEERISDLKRTNRYLKDMISRMELEKTLKNVTLDKDWVTFKDTKIH